MWIPVRKACLRAGQEDICPGLPRGLIGWADGGYRVARGLDEVRLDAQTGLECDSSKRAFSPPRPQAEEVELSKCCALHESLPVAALYISVSIHNRLATRHLLSDTPVLDFDNIQAPLG